MREDQNEPCAWMEHVNSFIYGEVGEGEALGHSGAWDVVLTDFDEWALGTYPAVCLTYYAQGRIAQETDV